MFLTFLPHSIDEQPKFESLECSAFFGWQWQHSLLQLLFVPIDAKKKKRRERERRDVKK
jgi:hypothetical protein